MTVRTPTTFACAAMRSHPAGGDGTGPARGTWLVAALGLFVRSARHRRAADSELAAMSDRDLADMSINRTDVTRLFDPAQAHDFTARGQCHGRAA